jgi:hypothetical protein
VKYTRNEENIHALVGIKIINTIREEHPELFDEDLEQRILHEAEEAFKSESKSPCKAFVFVYFCPNTILNTFKEVLILCSWYLILKILTSNF